MNDQKDNIYTDKIDTEYIKSYNCLQSKMNKLKNKDIFWNQDALSKLKDLENVVEDLYRDENNSIVKKTQETRDGGIDIVVDNDDNSCIAVEVKHWNQSSLGINILREMRGAIEEPEFDVNGIKPQNRNVVSIHLISTSGFSTELKRKVQYINENSNNNLDAKIIGPNELLYRLNKSNLNPKDYMI